MQSGSIQVASHEGTYMVRLQGDVRLTLCASFDAFIQAMLADKALSSVLVDCSGVQGMDSTTLGQLARMALGVQARLGQRAVLFCPDEDLRRLVDSMGFDDIFVIEGQPFETFQGFRTLAECNTSEAEMRQRVLDAHRTLMSLNERNRLAFRELVENLEHD